MLTIQSELKRPILAVWRRRILPKGEKKQKNIKWYNETVVGRFRSSVITDAKIKGLKFFTRDHDQILITITRADASQRTERLSWIKSFGLGEWSELVLHARKSRSR